MSVQFVKFKPDNFTAHVRTPWAGSRIVKTIKSGLGLNLPPYIGESWEFSTSSELPSRCDGVFDGTFSEFLSVGHNAELWLSDAHRKLWKTSSPLLIKYLDAADDLSVQLHPPIHAPELPSDESGKWESWLILGRKRGAGIYLGLEKGVTREMFANAVKSGQNLRPYLHFVPVRVGETYAIPPGTIHALGAGVCALEPQVLQPGKRALSLRLYDWNRCYDIHGNLSSSGTPRQLHVDEALKYMDVHCLSGKEFENQCRIKPEIITETSSFRIVNFNASPFLSSRVISGTGEYLEILPHELVCVLLMQGQISLTIAGQTYYLRAGEAGVISASAHDVLLQCQNARIYMAHALPTAFSQLKS